jgi:glycosyltransferase involved in cell wall biosynthesis
LESVVFSIVMSVYNGEKYVEEAILSILNQSYKEFEIIIIDDGSTDSSLELIKKMIENNPQVLLISQNNMGLIYSLNLAISKSKYEYIVRMDADDICKINRLEQIKKVITNNSYNLISSRAEIIDENNSYVCFSKEISDDNFILKRLPYINEIFHPSVCFKKSFFYDCGQYKPEEKSVEDILLWKRMVNKDVKYKFINEVLISYRINPDSVRGVDYKRYKYILALECLRQYRRKDARRYFFSMSLTDVIKFSVAYLLPFKLFDLYICTANKSKLRSWLK